MSSSNLDDTMTMWKEFTNFVFHKGAQSVLAQEPSISRGNIFRCLLRLNQLSRILGGEELTKYEVSCLGHLISTRQMPYCGKACERRALKSFKAVVGSSVATPPLLLAQLYRSAQSVGLECKVLADKQDTYITEESAHFSVTDSAEVDNTCEAGGNAAACMQALKSLDCLPADTGLISTVFTEQPVLVEGAPIWAVAYRRPPDITDCMKHSFMQPRDSIKEQYQRYWGLDQTVGKQLLWLCQQEAERNTGPLVIRANCVRENGNKARWITIAPYWVQSLEAPLAHILADMLRWHPACWSTFLKEDQCWQSLKVLCRATMSPGMFVLSSDLKEATNTIRHDVALTIVKGFMQGYWGRPIYQTNPYIRMTLGLIRPRFILFPMTPLSRPHAGYLWASLWLSPY
jgi:hypothetical protein